MPGGTNPLAMVPALGGADLTEIVPNVPSAGDGTDVGGTSLSATRAALASLFISHPIA